MDTLAIKPRSRFDDYAPSGKPLVITENDIRILELLQEYRYLPSTYISALLTISYDYLQERLKRLRKDGGLIKCPQPSWGAANAYYRPAVYALTEKGEQLLQERGRFRRIPKSGEPFEHEFISCLTVASLVIGIQEHPSLHLITADDILNHPACPPERRESKTPFQIPVSFTYTAPKAGTVTAIKTHIKHDWRPLGIGHRHPDGKVTRIFFPGIESDRRTESLRPESYAASSIKKHIIGIRELARTNGYRTHYGIPNSIIPFVTINRYHMHSIMWVVEEVTQGRGSKLFIFKHVPDFTSFEKFPPATGHMLTEPWDRVGYPPFDILKELGVLPMV